MESDWLRKSREAALARVLGAAGTTEIQGQSLRRLDAHWARRGLSLATRIHYATRGRLLGMSLGKPFEQATRADLESYLDGFAKNHAPYTIELVKRFLRVFYRGLLAPDDPGHPPIVSWIRQGKMSQISKRPQDMVSREEVLRIAGATTSPRDRALLMVLYESAARAGEVVSLRVGDVEMDSYGARLTLRGKTGMRKVRLIDSVYDVSEWLNFHPIRDDPDAPLFTSWGSQNRLEALRHDGLTRVLASAVEGAKINKRVHPHLFRHSRLTDLARLLSESELKVFAGWTADSSMAKVYVHLSGDDVDRKILEKRGLLNREAQTRPDPLVARGCPRCRTQNSPSSRFCTICKLPLDEKELLHMAEIQDKLVRNLPKLLRLVEDPRLKALLASPG